MNKTNRTCKECFSAPSGPPKARFSPTASNSTVLTPPFGYAERTYVNEAVIANGRDVVTVGGRPVGFRVVNPSQKEWIRAHRNANPSIGG